MIYVIATSDVKPGMRDEFLKIFNANVPKVKAEKGCLMYQPCTDFPSGLSAQPPCSETLVTILEAWASLDDLKMHLASAHMAKYREATRGMIVGKTLKIVEPA